ncbi:hypothetical protein EUX98_g7609 [Antrodiella citrinella]|uniref:Uncharacterized protein n=1 Tax=Antrodiella citrinella TaxID=2447956 RepID=A0A4S4MLM6_9APHY|nr:hypothetical protein EUX98_g7609 [Antrodiella citrinella]
MIFHSYYTTISWGFWQARRFFNLFISVNPNIHEALRYQEAEDKRYQDYPDAFVEPDESYVETSTYSPLTCCEDPVPHESFPILHSQDTLPKVLRSCRQMKYRSVSDAAAELKKAKERCNWATGTPRLRRTKRCVSWPMVSNADVFNQNSHDASLSDEYFEDRTDVVTEGPDHSSHYVTAPTMTTHEEQSSGYSQFVTARSSFECGLDSIDEDSVVHFFSPPLYVAAHYDSQPTYEPKNFPHSSGYGDTSSQTSSSILSSGLLSYRLNTPRLPMPSLMLTLPTPTIPTTPVFVPQSPITIPKYLHACSTPTAPSSQPSSRILSSAPSIPRCFHCGLAEFSSGTQCADCSQQWLACKIWYQAHDGGRNRYLTEPYIKPAESNARSRAIEDVLGVAGGSLGPLELGLGIEFETETPRKRRFWRFSRWLASAPVPAEDMQASFDSGNDLTLGLRSSGLGNIWAKTATGIGRLRAKVAVFRDTVHEDDIWESPEPDYRVPLPGRIPYAESRFVEHLAGQYGSLVICVS